MQYIKGDATRPIGQDNKLIIHICNNINRWGRGFVTALSAKWPKTKKDYHNWMQGNINNAPKAKLGQVQFINVTKDIYVANMIAQHGIRPINGVPPIRYESLKECLQTVRSWLSHQNNFSVHMPKIGAGLAGGDWDIISKIIQEELVDHKITTHVYIL